MTRPRLSPRRDRGLLLAGLVLVAEVFVVACGGDGGDRAATAPPSESTTTTEPALAPKPTPAEPAAAPTKGKTYAGETSQALPISVTISQDGRKVATLRIMWSAKCADGTTRSTTSILRNLVIGKKKGFQSVSAGNVTALMAGRFISEWKVIRGTWTAQILTGELLPGESFGFNDCNAGRVRWEARLR